MADEEDIIHPQYWDGTVLCPRKGLVHINHSQCLKLYDQGLCSPCENNQRVLQLQEEDKREEERRKQERKALAPSRKRGSE